MAKDMMHDVVNAIMTKDGRVASHSRPWRSTKLAMKVVATSWTASML
eukprot:CAMPEP_0180464172 /NCGR_PEP_ID=MMETSP1036_2-20121128/25309_1 /TAXON_ID=632150 /ORGANISM="Azadinium spinosum, Strain 3D9" /LENGTH=46 /DNA_ID= /DNA_START= /DNA_END= /DNA_ORIENTATION=